MTSLDQKPEHQRPGSEAALTPAGAVSQTTPAHQIRCGDIVRHEPSGEEWVVAWADYATNDLAWCGWPNGQARLSDCTLVKATTDEHHTGLVSTLLRCGDSRANHCRRLYVGGPSHG